MKLRNGKIIHKSNVSWLRPRKYSEKSNNTLIYDSLRYYMSKWRMKCAEHILRYDKIDHYKPIYEVNIDF